MSTARRRRRHDLVVAGAAVVDLAVAQRVVAAATEEPVEPGTAVEHDRCRCRPAARRIRHRRRDGRCRCPRAGRHRRRARTARRCPNRRRGGQARRCRPRPATPSHPRRAPGSARSRRRCPGRCRPRRSPDRTRPPAEPPATDRHEHTRSDRQRRDQHQASDAGPSYVHHWAFRTNVPSALGMTMGVTTRCAPQPENLGSAVINGPKESNRTERDRANTIRPDGHSRGSLQPQELGGSSPKTSATAGGSPVCCSISHRCCRRRRRSCGSLRGWLRPAGTTVLVVVWAASS